MIFIDTVNRLRQLPEREDSSFQRRPRTPTNHDSLTLSDAAGHVQQITLSHELAYELMPIDSILANILEMLLQQLEQQNITVQALSQLTSTTSDWQLTLQTPPADKPADKSPDYGEDLKPRRHQHNEKYFEFVVHGGDSSQKNLTLHFNIKHLRDDCLTAFKAIPPDQYLNTPYQAEQLENLPKRWSFEIDQDGESGPLEGLYDHIVPAKHSIIATGLQIWLQRKLDSLPILISDTQCGYIYIGNYGAYGSNRGESEPQIHLSGDIDTSA